jgi:hypothetical protein
VYTCVYQYIRIDGNGEEYSDDDNNDNNNYDDDKNDDNDDVVLIKITKRFTKNYFPYKYL